MEYDYKALKEKRHSIVTDAEIVLRQHVNNPIDLATSVVENFARLTPPSLDEVFAHYTTLNMNTRHGSSRKPGHLYLNWQKLMDIVPDVIIAGAGATTVPVWVVPFVGLYIWNKLWRGMKEEFSKIEAIIMFSLWKNKDSQHKIHEDRGYEVTNKTMSDAGMASISRAEYDSSINRLLRMKCIKLTEGIIWLRELVRVTYY